MTDSRKRLFFLFGLIVAFQWFIFAVMFTVEYGMSRSATLSARDLRLLLLEERRNAAKSFNGTMIHSCFSSTCLEQVAQELARVFPSRTDGAWCIASGRNKDPQDRWQGLILVKGA